MSNTTARSPRKETLPEQVKREPEVQGQKRNPRVPFQSGGKLSVPPGLIPAGYRGYWGVDRDGQIDQLQAAWYEFVTDSAGNKITANAGKGNAHYLMMIKSEYYEEDMKTQQDAITELEKASSRVAKGEYTDGTGGKSGEGTSLHRNREMG